MTHSWYMGTEAKFFRVSKLGGLRETEQVAAVCYRMRGGEIEFLLVQTGGGRWIFPKGGVELGLTHAQAAAIEAYEEAGVHGRIEEMPFTQYRVRRLGKQGSRRQVVTAHLCEVLRLGRSQETGRNRTWFSVSQAKSCLQEDRKKEDATELVRVIRKATARIEQSRGKAKPVAESPSYRAQKEPLQYVQLEATIGQQRGQIEAQYTRYIRRVGGIAYGLAEPDFAAGGLRKPVPRLAGSVPVVVAMQNVTAIDAVRGRTKTRR